MNMRRITATHIGGSVRASFGSIAPPMIKVLPPAHSGESGYLFTVAGTGKRPDLPR